MYQGLAALLIQAFSAPGFACGEYQLLTHEPSDSTIFCARWARYRDRGPWSMVSSRHTRTRGDRFFFTLLMAALTCPSTMLAPYHLTIALSPMRAPELFVFITRAAGSATMRTIEAGFLCFVVAFRIKCRNGYAIPSAASVTRAKRKRI